MALLWLGQLLCACSKTSFVVFTYELQIHQAQIAVQNPVLVDTVQKLTEKWLDALTEHKRLNCKELVPCDRLSAVKTVTRYFDTFATSENGCDPADAANYTTMLENWFCFCLIWGIGGSLDDHGRRAFDSFFREMDPRIPTSSTVFDYWLDPAQKTWVLWETKLPSTFRPQPGMPFFKVLVPTVDTHRNRVLATALLKQNYHVLFTGNVGVGKTMIASAMLDELPGGRTSMVINFSAQTSSNSLQVGNCILPILHMQYSWVMGCKSEPIERLLQKHSRILFSAWEDWRMLVCTPVCASLEHPALCIKWHVLLIVSLQF
jgi:hypothetical protein